MIDASDADELANDLMSDDDEGAAKVRPMKFAVRSCAKNSVEIALMELAYLDPILHRVCPFSETDQAENHGPPDDPEIAEARKDIGADYHRHIALARGMGERGATWQRYRELCALNGMIPLHHSDADLEKMREKTK